jgi:hypothetical protein
VWLYLVAGCLGTIGGWLIVTDLVRQRRRLKEWLDPCCPSVADEAERWLSDHR